MDTHHIRSHCLVDLILVVLADQTSIANILRERIRGVLVMYDLQGCMHMSIGYYNVIGNRFCV